MDPAEFPTSIPKTEATKTRMPQTILSFDYSGQKSPSPPTNEATLDRAHLRVQPESFFDSRLTLGPLLGARNLVFSSLPHEGKPSGCDSMMNH